jgi:hypothetical protein
MPSYCTGISHPEKGTSFAPAASWRLCSGVRRSVSVTDAKRPRGYREPMRRDDDDWVGEPPEGRYTRDRAKPEFWRDNWQASVAGVGIVIALLILGVVLLLK